MIKLKDKLNQTGKQRSGKLSVLAETLIGSEIVKLGGEIREKIKGNMPIEGKDSWV